MLIAIKRARVTKSLVLTLMFGFVIITTIPWNAKARVIAIFHTNAGHVTLHDDAYNIERKVAIGNPYKQLLAGLMKKGVEVELCGATATVHNWGNDDLLVGITVNTNAMARMSELAQAGSYKLRSGIDR